MTQKKIVFTGSTYSGKSALLGRLQKGNYSVIPEAGELVIAELNKEWGIEQQKQWRLQNPIEFYKLILDQQYDMEIRASKSSADLIFFDRGIPDYLAFLRLINVRIPQDFWRIARSCRYDMVFICEMIPGFDDRLSTGRSLDKAASEALGLLTEDIYHELRYSTFTLKASSIEDRLQTILETIQTI